MPKMKTRRGAAKRFKVRPSGKIKCGHANHLHLLECKSRKLKRHSRGTTSVNPVNAPQVARQLPYG